MINQKLQDFEEEVKAIGNVVTEATLDVYNTVVQRFLPTPAKIHYLFNLRDISKVSRRPIPRGPRSPASQPPQLPAAAWGPSLPAGHAPPAGVPGHAQGQQGLPRHQVQHHAALDP